MQTPEIYLKDFNQSTIRLVPYITKNFPLLKHANLIYHPWVILFDCGFIQAYAYNDFLFKEPVYLFKKVSSERFPTGIYPIEIITDNFTKIMSFKKFELYSCKKYKEIPNWNKLPPVEEIDASKICQWMFNSIYHVLTGVYFTTWNIPLNFLYNTDFAKQLVSSIYDTNIENVIQILPSPKNMDINKETFSLKKISSLQNLI